MIPADSTGTYLHEYSRSLPTVHKSYKTPQDCDNEVPEIRYYPNYYSNQGYMPDGLAVDNQQHSSYTNANTNYIPARTPLVPVGTNYEISQGKHHFNNQHPRTKPLLYEKAKPLRPNLDSNRNFNTRQHSSESGFSFETNPPHSTTVETKSKSHNNHKAAMIAGFVKIFFILLTISMTYILYVKRKTFVPYATRGIDWVKSLGVAGPVVYASIYALWTTILLPGEFLVLASGFIFTNSTFTDTAWVGIVVACLAVFGGLWLVYVLLAGGSVIFLSVRYWFAPTWKAKVENYDICKATLMAMDDGGLWFLLLFRASPLMPFAISNVVLGLSKMSYLTWNIGLLGCAPAVLSSTVIGSQLATIHDLFEEEGEQDHKGALEMLCIVLIPSVLFVVVAWFLVKKRMNEIKGDKEKKKKSTSSGWKETSRRMARKSRRSRRSSNEPLNIELREYQPGTRVA
eukprot:GHVH01002097.1.p1 GENE.GHVH01002097.1~~GHVH01002097.1.p1  ORF type:complete len:456 (-),score=35.57 GHVH01002097.1:899-2266(-)